MAPRDQWFKKVAAGTCVIRTLTRRKIPINILVASDTGFANTQAFYHIINVVQRERKILPYRRRTEAPYYGFKAML